MALGALSRTPIRTKLTREIFPINPSRHNIANTRFAKLATAGDGGNAGSRAYVPNAYLFWALNQDWYVGIGMSWQHINAQYKRTAGAVVIPLPLTHLMVLVISSAPC